MFAATSAIRAPATRAVINPERCGSGCTNVGVGLTSANSFDFFQYRWAGGSLSYVKPVRKTGPAREPTLLNYRWNGASVRRFRTGRVRHGPETPCAARGPADGSIR